MCSPRQWRGCGLAGEPAQFQDPAFDTIAARTKAFGELGALIAELFAGQTMERLVADGQAHGCPSPRCWRPSAALESEHFRAVGALTDAELAPGSDPIPVGYWVLDGSHAGYRTPAPPVGDKRCLLGRNAVRPAGRATGGVPAHWRASGCSTWA